MCLRETPIRLCYRCAATFRLEGADDNFHRTFEAECLCRFEVEDQLDFGGLLDRQVGGLLAFENAPDVDTDLTVRIGETASIAHQAACRGESAKLVAVLLLNAPQNHFCGSTNRCGERPLQFVSC
jgi:hypothetical protein